MKVGSILAQIFYDHNGKLSFGRVMGTVILLWYLIMATYIGLKKGELIDVPEGVLLLVIGLYGVNKFSYAIQNRREKNV